MTESLKTHKFKEGTLHLSARQLDMSTSLFRHFYFRFACAISHRIWPWSAVENGGRRSELEMFAEYKLQPVDILREEALLSLARDLERDSNPRRARPAALHLHAQRIRTQTGSFSRAHLVCTLAATCKGPQVIVSHTPDMFQSPFLCHII